MILIKRDKEGTNARTISRYAINLDAGRVTVGYQLKVTPGQWHHIAVTEGCTVQIIDHGVKIEGIYHAWQPYTGNNPL